MSEARRPAPFAAVAAPALVALGCVLASAPARAQVSGAVFTGGDFDQNDSGYLGAQIAAAKLRGGATVQVRAVATGGVYAYRRDGRMIDGWFVGAQVGPMMQWAGADGYFEAGVGARYVDTRLSPRDPQNRRRGGVFDALLSVDGQRRSAAWTATGYAEYGTGIEDYLVRASVTRDVAPRWRVGPEVILQGDPTYDRQRGGVLFGWRRSASSEIQFSVGGGRQSGRGGDAYGTVAFTHAF